MSCPGNHGVFALRAASPPCTWRRPLQFEVTHAGEEQLAGLQFLRHLPFLCAGIERLLRINCRLPAHVGLPAGGAQILPHDLDPCCVGGSLAALVVGRIGHIPDIAWMIGAEHGDLLSRPRLYLAEAQHRQIHPVLLRDPTAHRRTKGDHRQAGIARAAAELADHAPLIAGEVAINAFQGTAGTGRGGNGCDVDDGLVSGGVFRLYAIETEQRGSAICGARTQIILSLSQ